MLILLGSLAGETSLEEKEYNGSDGLDGKEGPNPAFGDDFSQLELKIGYYRFSYRICIGSTSSCK